MDDLRVWAPRAAAADVETGGARVPMRADAGGWWTLGRALPAGTEYTLWLDGQGPLPDPRSADQPRGVHGPSRVVDHEAFRWTDAGWRAPPLGSGVLYELHVGTFTEQGTFDGVVRRLEHLRELGVTHVEVMPVASFAGRRGWGYDGVTLFAPHAAYGGPDGLKRLVDACHARGLAVLLDVVMNHLGPEGNYLDRFGPYHTSAYATPWGAAINLDGAGSHEVRRFFIDNARSWLRDYHLDGLRLDAVHALHDRSAVHLLEELSDEVAALSRALGRPLVLVAESDQNDPRLVRAREAGGLGMDAAWSDDLHHALHAALTGERQGYYEDFGRLADVARALERGFVFDGRYSAHRDRRHGRPATGVPAERFVVSLQNHDQVGNRAQGDRIGRALPVERLQVGAALLLCAPFVPLLFQGEEWNATAPFAYFSDFQDAGLGEAVRDGRRREFAAFGWDPESIPDPQAEATLLASRLDWGELARPEHARVLAWYRALLRLRASRPDLRGGPLEATRVRHDDAAGWLVVDRPHTTIAANLGPSAHTLQLDPRRPAHLLLASRDDVLVLDGAVRLPPDSCVILG